MAIRKNPLDCTVGADPEFMCLSNGEVVISSKYVDMEDKFSRDAYDKLFELKPNASTCPIEVSENLRQIMQEAVSENPTFLKWDWICDSFHQRCPMGGHLHVGISKNIISPKDACSQFLDHYVGAITLLLEDRRKGLARRNYRRKDYRYGFASDFREKKWGFEYRSPSSWITSPEVAKAILCLFKVVCYEMINNRSFKPNVYVNPEDFETMNIVKLRKEFPLIWRDITKMLLYSKYQKELKLIKTLVSEKKTWISRDDMKTTWGLLSIPKQSKLTLEDIWGKYR